MTSLFCSILWLVSYEGFFLSCSLTHGGAELCAPQNTSKQAVSKYLFHLVVWDQRCVAGPHLLWCHITCTLSLNPWPSPTPKQGVFSCWDQPAAAGVSADRDAVRHPAAAAWGSGGEGEAAAQHWGSWLGHYAALQLQTVSHCETETEILSIQQTETKEWIKMTISAESSIEVTTWQW